MNHLQSTIVLRGRLLLCGAVMLAALVATGLTPPQGTVAQTEQAGSNEEARALLARAAEAMAEVPSFHFKLTTEGGTTTIMEGIEIDAVEGDVVRPDRFQAELTASIEFISLDLDIIGIGDRLWVTDPMSESGEFIEISTTNEAGVPLVDILNPDRLLLEAVELIENPEVTGSDEIDGVDATRIEGAVDLSTIDMATPGPVPLDLDPKPVSIWIDDQGRVVRLRLDGPLTAAEPDSISRQLDLTAFGEEIEITPPAKS